eukprot:10164409-Karenia_brevis.AAC.1
MSAVRLLMRTFCDVFASLGLTIDFAAGKTEALMQLRGYKSQHYVAKLRQPDGTDAIMLTDVPGSPKLRIVQQYKHLGGIVCNDGCINPEAIARANSAMEAYAPLAMIVFGARAISADVRISLAHSLVFSRLFYNVCT